MKYSVIIPVYNAEKTIDRCVQSLISQNYHDAEIILVNDGSTDNSGLICQSYADRHSQIRCINKENGGVSTARNTGLDAAAGTYVLFVDSDDYVSNDYFESLDRISSDVDYAVFSYHLTDGESVQTVIFETFSSVDSDSFYSKISWLLYRKYINFPVNKRFSRSIIEKYHLRYHADLSIGEDSLFNFQYALHCSSCCISKSALYYVSIENKQSLSRKIRSDLHEQIALCDSEMRHAIQTADINDSHTEQLQNALNFLNMSEIYSEAKRMHKQCFGIWHRLKEIRRLCVSFNASKVMVPKDRYCQMLLLPVKLRLSVLIDLVGWKLASR